jgi:hypothetical protein
MRVLETQMKGKLYFECLKSVEWHLLQHNSIFHSLKYKKKKVNLHDLLQMQRAVSNRMMFTARD